MLTFRKKCIDTYNNNLWCRIIKIVAHHFRTPYIVNKKPFIFDVEFKYVEIYVSQKYFLYTSQFSYKNFLLKILSMFICLFIVYSYWLPLYNKSKTWQWFDAIKFIRIRKHSLWRSNNVSCVNLISLMTLIGTDNFFSISNMSHFSITIFLDLYIFFQTLCHFWLCNIFHIFKFCIVINLIAMTSPIFLFTSCIPSILKPLIGKL